MSAPSLSAPAHPTRPRLELVVVRTPGPPLEDERHPVRLLTPGPRPRPLPPAPGPRPRPDAPPDTAEDADFGPTWTRRAQLPDAQAAGRRLVTLTLEAFAGRRPVTQLQPLVTPQLFAALSGRRRPRWCTEGTSPLLVSSVRVCEPVDGVAEVAAVARRAGRAHAVAARLEGIDGRWRCTALQIG
ncbi:Rv3235 family protein [Modestobacter marinus]|uniref:Rv3235 family protein n=1 Tax=Modestobacter marinus TaxID=477641 RepID=UPI001C98B282|nr:Rv3235 family protein [Modestobacter marinus]